ncbi:hypothetical protein QAD02_009590, partial [Eretmocerus hayati]
MHYLYYTVASVTPLNDYSGRGPLKSCHDLKCQQFLQEISWESTGTLPPFAVLTGTLVGCRRRQPLTAIPSTSGYGAPFSRNEASTTREENQEQVRVSSFLSTADPSLVPGPSSSQESFPTEPPDIENRGASSGENVNWDFNSYSQSFPCKFCGRIFEKRHELRKHAICHSENRPFSCELCNQKSKRKQDLIDHMKSHSDDRPYACKLCDRSFKRKCDLGKHRKFHDAICPFSCELCGKGFMRKDKLNIHMKSHSDERPFTCETCGKKFKHKSILREHMNSHDIDRKPAGTCKICNKEILCKDNLRRHMKIHSDDRPFTCDVCNKSFKHKYTLERHMKTHTNDRPYQCKLCDQRFKRKDDLKKHMRIHTDLRTLKCEKCRKPFRSRIQLEQHRESHCTNGVGLETFSCGTYFQSFECDDDSIEHSWTHEQNFNMQEPETIVETTGELEQENTSEASNLVPMNVDRYLLVESTSIESTDHLEELNQSIEANDDLDPDLQVSVSQ